MTHYYQSKARLTELFVSIQGEGPLVGIRQAFIRFAGCNLNCRYCDTDFRGKFSCGVSKICNFLQESMPIHSVVLTGGEPLLQVEFLKYFLPYLKEKLGLNVYLETNGTLANQLSEIAGYLDWICMDVKIPSIAGVELWQEHSIFIDAVPNSSNLILKVVLDITISAKDRRAFESLLLDKRRDMIIVLQPIYSLRYSKELSSLLLRWQKELMQIFGLEVRVIPQVHKVMGLL